MCLFVCSRLECLRSVFCFRFGVIYWRCTSGENLFCQLSTCSALQCSSVQSEKFIINRDANFPGREWAKLCRSALPVSQSSGIDFSVHSSVGIIINRKTRGIAISKPPPPPPHHITSRPHLLINLCVYIAGRPNPKKKTQSA